ncbi:MAG: prolipoprotein diacylglyceryl transferase family protein, partial [Candidatus Neomarinimicrobiota bacterium]
PPTTTSVFAYQFPWIDISDLPVGVIKVHPTQLYETLICGGLFYYLWSKRKNIQVQGSLFFQYLVFAGFERFLIEFLRTNEKYAFDIFSGAQILSLLMIIFGSYFLLYPIYNDKTNIP